MVTTATTTTSRRKEVRTAAMNESSERRRRRISGSQEEMGQITTSVWHVVYSGLINETSSLAFTIRSFVATMMVSTNRWAMIVMTIDTKIDCNCELAGWFIWWTGRVGCRRRVKWNPWCDVTFHFVRKWENVSLECPDNCAQVIYHVKRHT